MLGQGRSVRRGTKEVDADRTVQERFKEDSGEYHGVGRRSLTANASASRSLIAILV